MDESDLSDADRSAIEEAEQLAKGTHWQVLGLVGEVSSADVKRAYFVASKRFHPDRYFGKRLGPYRQRLEALFIRAKVAYDVLGDDFHRATYAIDNPPPAPPQPAQARNEQPRAEQPKTEQPRTEQPKAEQPKPSDTRAAQPSDPDRDRRLEERRRQIAEERKSKLKGQVLGDLRSLKIRRLQLEARNHLDAGKLEVASRTISELLTEAPNAKETIILSAELCERQGKRDQALEKYRAALELDASDLGVKTAVERLTGQA